MFTTSDDSIAIKNMHLRHDKILNKEDWISFDNEEYPWLGKVWWDILSENKHTINNENLHPNLEGVIQFSNRIAPKIKPLVQ
jgi:lysophospholipase L1-like esterase